MVIICNRPVQRESGKDFISGQIRPINFLVQPFASVDFHCSSPCIRSDHSDCTFVQYVHQRARQKKSRLLMSRLIRVPMNIVQPSAFWEYQPKSPLNFANGFYILTADRFRPPAFDRVVIAIGLSSKLLFSHENEP